MVYRDVVATEPRVDAAAGLTATNHARLIRTLDYRIALDDGPLVGP